jgi:glutaminyl-peptide cyclotransferase
VRPFPHLLSLLAAGALLAAPGCARDPADPAVRQAASVSAKVPAYSYEVVKVFPHDRGAFTEGLDYLPGFLLESTGLNGSSTLRKVDLESGRIVQQVALPAEYFGEGAAVIGGQAYQLTWKNQIGFIYDLATLARQGQFSYEGEGWGLTTDGRSLIMSDGTNRIRFLDPATFRVTRSIQVFSQGRPLEHLNELEWVKGELFANIWQTPVLARIDPATGRLLGLVDLSGLLAPEDLPGSDVLNGIAYDAAGDRLFVTGKNWPKLFQIRLKPE